MGFSPSWKLETPGSTSPAPRLWWQKMERTNDDFLLWMAVTNALSTPSVLPRACQCPPCLAKLLPKKMHLEPCPKGGKEEVDLLVLLCKCSPGSTS